MLGISGAIFDVDCSTRITPALYVYRNVYPSVDSGTCSNSAHSDGHLPEHRYSGCQRSLELHRPLAGRDVQPHRLSVRAGTNHDSQQHRAHRIAIPKWNWRRQNLFSSRRGYWQRRGASDRGLANPLAYAPGGNHSSAHHPIQRLQRSHSATGVGRRRALGAAAG